MFLQGEDLSNSSKADAGDDRETVVFPGEPASEELNRVRAAVTCLAGILPPPPPCTSLGAAVPT